VQRSECNANNIDLVYKPFTNVPYLKVIIIVLSMKDNKFAWLAQIISKDLAREMNMAIVNMTFQEEWTLADDFLIFSERKKRGLFYKNHQVVNC
jgi:hypothetical protein